MAALVGRVPKNTFLKVSTPVRGQKATFTSNMKGMSTGKKVMAAIVGTTVVGSVGFVTALNSSVNALDLVLHPPKYHWHKHGWFSSHDADSARRGYEVYKNVCAACHSLDYIRFRDFVGHIMTEKEAKAEALEAQIVDGPDVDGNMFERPGKLFDNLPKPYANEEAARAANNGALPPDLSLINGAREGGEDYIFALLTGYQDAPAGITLGEGQHYNPYFPGGSIGMAQALYNEILEYEDGTPATQSQCAKDVTNFLAWTNDPNHNKRQSFFLKFMFWWFIGISTVYYYTRHKFVAFNTSKHAIKHLKLKKK